MGFLNLPTIKEFDNTMWASVQGNSQPQSLMLGEEVDTTSVAMKDAYAL